MKKILTGDITKLVLVCFGLVTVSCCLYAIPTKDYNWFFIIWNCFLAVLPVYFAMCAKYFLSIGKKAKSIISSFLWLLFFPNTLYMLTDLKYLSNFPIETWDDFQNLSQNIIQWLFLGNVVISVLSGVLFGMMSLYIMHTLFLKRWGKYKCCLAITALLTLSSFGIYIGRFPRLNSWDILRPMFLIEKTLSSMTVFTIFFVLFFSLLSGAIYLIFYLFVKKQKLSN